MSTSTSITTSPARGMRDLLPKETALRDWAIGRLVKTYESFGFTRIETPAVENIAQLRGAEGGENLNLIFEILKRGDKLQKVLEENSANIPELLNELSDLGLRFDLTVPLVRFFAHNQAQLQYPFKTIQIGPVWRAESPQAGRYRQFTQCDIDMFGVKSEIAEMELIQATSEALLDLGFEKFTVRINDRRILNSLVKGCGFSPDQYDSIFIQIDKLDKIGPEGVENELLAHKFDKEAISNLMGFLKHFISSDKSYENSKFEEPLPSFLMEKEGMAEVWQALTNVIKAIQQISQNRYAIQYDPTLVRGMGYYTGLIFEIAVAGAAHSIAGGGRYDKMVGKFSGRDVPACGFSIGFERIISILLEKDIKTHAAIEKIAVIYDQDRDAVDSVFLKSNSLRKTERHVSLLPRKKDMRKQIDSLMIDGFNGYAAYHPDKEHLEIKMLTG